MSDHLNILIVDDDAVDRMALRRALKAANLPHTLHEAEDAEQALDLLSRVSFDCMFLDDRLPGTDGLVVLHRIRERNITTPIVVLTGQGDEQLAVELLRSGATDYLTKGLLSPEVLSQSVRRALRLHRAEIQVAQAEQALLVAASRQRFLAVASQELVETLETATILDRLVRLTVQNLADSCAVDMVGEDGKLSRVAAAVRDPDDSNGLQALEYLQPQERNGTSGPAAVFRTGQSLLYTNVADTLAGGVDTHLLSPLAHLAVRSLMIVPLIVRGQTLGAITFVTRVSGRSYDAADLVLAEDLTHRVGVALDNARLYREAQEAVRVRDAFLSVAAHELKTPLTSLFGNAQLLQRRAQRENSMNERDVRTLRVVVEQAARLNRMITALLDLSRLQMGQFNIELGPVDLTALTQRVVDELQPSLEQHTVELTGDALPILVMGDELRLEQVLQNLIQNAVKYSPKGGVVHVHLGRRDQWATVAVSDEGIGIPKDALPNLFRRFYRAHNAKYHHISGIGVGLYVVSEIITRHGGSITVTSTEGTGSTFTVTLPVDKGSQESSTPLLANATNHVV